MPFAGFKNFSECVLHMKSKEGYSDEVASKVCGKLKHDYEKQHPEDAEPKAKISASLAIKQNGINFTECSRTGDTIFHNVTLISEGAWADRINKRPIHYTSAELMNMRFGKMIFKAEHDLYDELPSTNDIGIIENVKLSINPTQWNGDVRVYPTALGKDIAILIKRKQITDISSELFFDEISHDDVCKGITFMGAATVRKGACRVCTFNEGASEMADAKYSKEQMKEMLSDIKSHPEMVDDDMKSMMNGMMGYSKAMNSGIDKMTEPTQNPAGSPGGAAAELETGGQNKTYNETLEAQLSEAIKTNSQDVKVLTAQLEQVKDLKIKQMAAELEVYKKKVPELEQLNKQLAAELAKRDHTQKVKELEKQIAELAKQPVYRTVVNGAELATSFRPNANIDSDPEFSPVSSRDME